MVGWVEAVAVVEVAEAAAVRVAALVVAGAEALAVAILFGASTSKSLTASTASIMMGLPFAAGAA